jgi:hypothetical protein
MIYAQIKSGHKLHLAYEAGEGRDDQHIIKAGNISNPLCNARVDTGYRMTINFPLGNACKNCLRIYHARGKGE